MISGKLTLLHIRKADLSAQLPFFAATISAGFPSPADDYIEERFSLDKLVIRDPSTTYFLRVDGDSMTGAGIYDKDIIVVDTSLKAKNNDIVVARIEGEFILKRLVKTPTGYILKAENENYPPIELTDYSDCIICGVVTYTLHKP